MMIRILFFCCLLFIGLLNADDISNKEDKKVRLNCLILEDENSVICKIKVKRIDKKRVVKVLWISPNGTDSRHRDMIIPANHGSIYDYRYIEGREVGTWTFSIILEDESYSTTFELK